MRLFIKPGCPWCDEAEEWLTERGYQYEVVNVMADDEAWEEMKRLSRQTKCPTLEVNGLVLADFGADELAAFVRKHKIGHAG